MPEPKKWWAAYQKLKDYISFHNEIRITDCKVSIPDRFRQEFYELFDLVIEAFLEEKDSVQLMLVKGFG